MVGRSSTKRWMSGSKALVVGLAIGATRPGLPLRLTRKLERDTPSTSAIRFTASLPSEARAAARSVFCLGFGERFPEDLVLPGLAAEQGVPARAPLLETPNSELPTTVQPNSLLPRLSRSQTAPAVEKIGSTPCRATDDTVSPGSKLSSMIRSFASVTRPMPTARDAGDHLDALIVLGHKPVIKLVVEPFCLCRVSDRNGGSSAEKVSLQRRPMPGLYSKATAPMRCSDSA
ncbi:hypothetical protein SAMN05428953_12170 [Mesorhizobium muleiense]|uniref:Uncharacterized protein n=1 Tax=Mesorhizobium muleiense TaxID=1004279 RepID=A0A1G9F4Q6_9HYPH|nr:hypothetical protein SAMN05428953_12170 [Mesorhizobium muleiense]